MTNKEYELFAKAIYQELLKEQGITVEVKHNQIIQGKATKHQIDVYWEVNIAGVLARFAIECKNYNSLKNPVGIGRVRDFYGMLADIGNINGIMVTKRKYQKGAKKFAKYYGINLMTLYKPFQIFEVYTQSIFPVSKSISYSFGEEARLISPNITDDDIKTTLGSHEAWDTMEVCKSDGTKKAVSQMIRELPHNEKAETGLSKSYEFDDHYLHLVGIGLIQLKSLLFNYDVHVQRTDLTEHAKQFEITALKDVQDGKLLHFDSNGKKLDFEEITKNGQ